MLPNIFNAFKQINVNRNPNKKKEYLKELFTFAISIIKFNEGQDKQPWPDEITPLLIYLFIKAHPYRIHSDIEFIGIFCDKENEIIDFENIYNYILNFKEKILV